MGKNRIGNMGCFTFAMSVIGHQKIQDFFIRAIDRGVLSHAYAFIGSEHIGKETLAIWITGKILKITPEKIFSHPDVRIVRRSYDEKNERLKRDISVDEMRDVIRFASESPFFQNGYKIIIVAEAGRLNAESGNALLKMLEEPPTRTVFFLLYQNEYGILPTIRSRVQSVFLSCVSDSDMKKDLAERGYDPKNIERVVPIVRGLPGQAIKWLEDDNVFLEFQKIAPELEKIMFASVTEKFRAVQVWFDAAKADGGVDYVVSRLDEWRTVLAGWIHAERPPVQLSCILAILDNLDRTVNNLRRNAHPPLAVQSFLLTF